MTAVPKPLKFLAPHLATLKAIFDGMPAAHANKKVLADVLSVLAMTMGVEGKREVLAYRLLGSGAAEDVGEWGHEYVRALAGETGAEWRARVDASPSGPAPPLADLTALVHHIVPFNMGHNAEPEAVDLLLEIGRLPLLLELNYAPAAPVGGSNAAAPATGATAPASGSSAARRAGAMDKDSASRVCLYLLKCADYMGDVKEIDSCLETAQALYMEQGEFPSALRVALRRGGSEEEVKGRVTALFAACGDDMAGKRQLAYMLGRHGISVSVGDDSLDAVIGQHALSGLFATLARELDVMDAKTPEDIYKSHLSGDARVGEAAGASLDSARGNLASTYVNAFVNAGFGSDKLMTPADSAWVYRNKGEGQTAAVASLGMIHLWNEQQINAMDKYLSASEDAVKAGALLGIALACAGQRNSQADPCFALLSEHLEEGSSSSVAMKVAALQGLGIVYVGARREDIADLCLALIQDSSATASMEVASLAALCLGQVWLGSAHEVYAALLADRLISCNDAEAGMAITRHMGLGLGLLFLGRCELADMVLEILSVITASTEEGGKAHGKVSKTIVQACAYAGTGDVLQIQSFLRSCAEHPEMDDKEKAAKTAEDAATAAGNAAAAAAAGSNAAAGGAGAAAAAPAAARAPGGSAAAGAVDADKDKERSKMPYLHQTAAVLGLGLVSLGEELSVSLAGRMADHLLQYGDPAVRRGVPIALAIVHLSDPEYGTVDTLSKLSHDQDADTAQAAILGLGLVGAGSNNSRIAGLLRTLAVFHKSEAEHLFLIRIAQGLLHMGKVRHATESVRVCCACVVSDPRSRPPHPPLQGLITLHPVHSERLLVSPVALAGILPALLCCLDFKATLIGKWHTMLFNLAAAMNPRMLMTVNEAGEPLPVEVRVGQAVETVGQAGKPKTITGFQTHITPVLLLVKDRAELSDDAYIALSPVLEGIVVLRPNPEAAGRKLREAAAKEEKERRAKLGGGGARGRADLTWG